MPQAGRCAAVQHEPMSEDRRGGRRRWAVLCAAAFCALAGSTAPSHASRTTSTGTVFVRGTVTGRKGVALDGVEVSLEAEPTGPAFRTRTGSTGTFRLDAVETGRYRLRLRYRETDGSGVVDITEDKQIDVALDVDP